LTGQARLSTGDDLDNLKPVTRLQLPPPKLRRGNRIAVMFDYDAPGQEVL